VTGLETLLQTKFTGIWDNKVTTSLDNGRNSKYSARIENFEYTNLFQIAAIISEILSFTNGYEGSRHLLKICF
jgi:hypothetical protein